MDCEIGPIFPAVDIPRKNFDPKIVDVVIIEDTLNTLFTGTGCEANSSWKSCTFYGTKPSHLSIDTKYPFAISADLSPVGGYDESFIVTCTDGDKSYQSTPTKFIVDCVTIPITPAVVIPNHPYDPVHKY